MIGVFVFLLFFLIVNTVLECESGLLLLFLYTVWPNDHILYAHGIFEYIYFLYFLFSGTIRSKCKLLNEYRKVKKYSICLGKDPSNGTVLTRSKSIITQNLSECTLNIFCFMVQKKKKEKDSPSITQVTSRDSCVEMTSGRGMLPCTIAFVYLNTTVGGLNCYEQETSLGVISSRETSTSGMKSTRAHIVHAEGEALHCTSQRALSARRLKTNLVCFPPSSHFRCSALLRFCRHRSVKGTFIEIHGLEDWHPCKARG